jgi:hypothetical protein
MLPSERLELAIYNSIKRGLSGQGAWDTSMPMLSPVTAESDHGAIAERLKDLEANNRILLSKYSGGQRWPRGDSPDRAFFHTGSFSVEVAPQGRKYFEGLEQRAEHEAKKSATSPGEPLILVSCGQSTPAERQHTRGAQDAQDIAFCRLKSPPHEAPAYPDSRLAGR